MLPQPGLVERAGPLVEGRRPDHARTIREGPGVGRSASRRAGRSAATKTGPRGRRAWKARIAARGGLSFTLRRTVRRRPPPGERRRHSRLCAASLRRYSKMKLSMIGIACATRLSKRAGFALRTLTIRMSPAPRSRKMSRTRALPTIAKVSPALPASVRTQTRSVAFRPGTRSSMTATGRRPATSRGGRGS